MLEPARNGIGRQGRSEGNSKGRAYALPEAGAMGITAIARILGLTEAGPGNDFWPPWTGSAPRFLSTSRPNFNRIVTFPSF